MNHHRFIHMNLSKPEEILKDRKAWRVAVHGVIKSQTQLSDWITTCPLSQWWLSNHLIFCHPLLLLPSIFSSIRDFSSESALSIRCQSIGAHTSASVLPMNIQGSFSLGLTDLISLQSTRLWRGQHHNSKASILQSSDFFMVQLIHPYTTTWKSHSCNVFLPLTS